MLVRNILLLVGDSITESSFDVNYRGFGAQLANVYSRTFDVINRGFAGWTTVGINGIIDEILEPFPEVGIATLFLGANDASPGKEQHVPLPKYQNLLKKISTKMLKTTSKLIIITPSYVDDNSKWDRRNNITITYRNAAIEVAQELNIPFLDTWNLFTGRQIENAKDIKQEDLKYFWDGLHFNRMGNNKMFEGLSKLIDSIWLDRKPSDLMRQATIHVASSKI